MNKKLRAAALIACGLMMWNHALAQRGSQDWMTAGTDAQRSSWVRSDPKIFVDALRKGGFELLWKLKLNNETRQLNSLTPPPLFDFYISYRGFRTLGFFGGSSNRVIGIDTDLGRLEWEVDLGSRAAGPAGTVLCPGGMTAAVTRPTNIGYPPTLGARGFGRSGPGKSGVGEPLEGSVQLKERAAARPAPPAPPPARRRQRTAPAANPFGRTPQYVHAITSDGKFHWMYVSNGEQPLPAVQFLPPNANAQGLIIFDNTAYAATVNGCGGVPDGVWALNLETKKVTQWKAAGNVVGQAGLAVDPDGNIYVATAKEVAALEAGTLKPKARYAPGGAAFVSSPLVFEHKGKDMIAVAAADGSVHLLGSSLGNAVAKSSGGGSASSLASWQDEAGTRWLLASGDTAVVAWKVVERGGSMAFERGWTSPAMTVPLTPVVVNDVVFVISSGEHRAADAKTTVSRSKPAVLYALEGTSGKELWNSGGAITSFVHSGGLSAGGGRVYLADFEGNQYAFGFPMEH